MKHILKSTSILLLACAAMVVSFTACNKGLNEIGGNPPVSPNTTTSATIGDTLATTIRANNSLFYAMIVRAGLLNTLKDRTNRVTIFAPTNDGVKRLINGLSGGLVSLGAPDATFLGFINSSLPAASAAGIVSYSTISQYLPQANIPATFPNFPSPTLLNPAPTLSAFLRLNVYPSSRNGLWVNNLPLVSTDLVTGNGIIHEVPNVLVPPQTYLWDRIVADTASPTQGLRYLKAAIQRADSGVAVTAATSLEGALKNIGANLTVYAPTDSAFKVTLTAAITQGLISLGVPPALAAAQAAALAASPTVFANPALYSVLTAERVKGIIVYHLMGVRVFNNNMPTTTAFFPTLLNSAIPQHPGVGLTATITGGFTTSASVKGFANATAAKVYINPTPGTGTSDQNYLNGVFHKIDQVLLPL